MTDARRRAKQLGANRRVRSFAPGLWIYRPLQGIGASDRTRTGDIQNHNLAL